MLADGRPGTVRIAASGAAGSLRLTVNVNGVGESTAFAIGLLVGSTRDNGAIATGIGIPPGNRGPRLTTLQGFHLRCIGSLLVFVIERRANSVADQATEHATYRGASQPVSCSAARDRCPHERTGTCSDHGAGTLPRPRCGHWTRRRGVRARDTGAKGETDDCEDGELGREHIESI